MGVHYDPWFTDQLGFTSFPGPVTPPTTDPTIGPFLCVPVPEAYFWLVLGAAQQLLQPFAWNVPDDATRNLTLDWIDELLGRMGQADYCMQSGTVSLTILAGAVTAASTVTFPTAFAATADVVVSESTGLYIASSYSPSTTGVGVSITSNVPVVVNSSATLTWLARAHV